MEDTVKALFCPFHEDIHGLDKDAIHRDLFVEVSGTDVLVYIFFIIHILDDIGS